LQTVENRFIITFFHFQIFGEQTQNKGITAIRQTKLVGVNIQFAKARKSQIKVYFVYLTDTTEKIRAGPYWFGTVVQYSENN